MEGNGIFCLPTLPLPSILGHHACDELGINTLADDELALWMGQANNALHSIRLALANKVVVFCTNVWHTKSHTTNTRVWARVSSADAILARHAAIYQKCCNSMVALGASESLLQQYRPLIDPDLKVNTAMSDPNGSQHHQENLAWFWTIDIL